MPLHLVNERTYLRVRMGEDEAVTLARNDVDKVNIVLEDDEGVVSVCVQEPLIVTNPNIDVQIVEVEASPIDQFIVIGDEDDTLDGGAIGTLGTLDAGAHAWVHPHVWDAELTTPAGEENYALVADDTGSQEIAVGSQDDTQASDATGQLPAPMGNKAASALHDSDITAFSLPTVATDVSSNPGPSGWTNVNNALTYETSAETFAESAEAGGVVEFSFDNELELSLFDVDFALTRHAEWSLVSAFVDVRYEWSLPPNVLSPVIFEINLHKPAVVNLLTVNPGPLPSDSGGFQTLSFNLQSVPGFGTDSVASMNAWTLNFRHFGTFGLLTDNSFVRIAGARYRITLERTNFS